MYILLNACPSADFPAQPVQGLKWAKLFGFFDTDQCISDLTILMVNNLDGATSGDSLPGPRYKYVYWSLVCSWNMNSWIILKYLKTICSKTRQHFYRNPSLQSKVFRCSINLRQEALDVAHKEATNENKREHCQTIYCLQKYLHQRHNHNEDNNQEEMEKMLLRWRPRHFCLLMASHLLRQPRPRAAMQSRHGP